MNTTDEKPWILEYSYRLDPVQISQEERDTLMQNLKDGKEGATLKDGSYLSLKNIRIMANEHYVSPESVALGRKHQEWIDEYHFLKREGQLVTQQEYVEWKKKSIARNKALDKYLKEPAENENEKKRTT
jgi:hypothetical protein